MATLTIPVGELGRSLNQVGDLMREVLTRRLAAAALVLQTEHRRRLSKPNPAPHTNPAPKGQYPRLRTGFGRGQVLLDLSKLGAPDPTAIVGVGSPGAYLEMLAAKGWKGLGDTADELGPRLIRMVVGGGV